MAAMGASAGACSNNLSENTLFYLHPSENPGLILVTPPLNSTNYLSWSRSMRRALRSKKKWPMVDGSVIPPAESDDSYDAWEGSNSMVLSWLVGSMEPAIARSVSCLETAVAVWADLQGRFGRGDSMRIARLQLELCSLKQGALSVTDYFTIFRTLWDDFCEFRPIHLCKCVDREKGSAICESVSYSHQYQENDQVIRFLIGLNENYSTVTSQIMLMDPLPDVNRALFLALQHEQQLLNGTSSAVALASHVGSASHSSSGNAFQVSNVAAVSVRGKQSWNNSKRAAICTYCGKEGHTVEKCYRKRGFPPNFKFTKNMGSGPVNRNHRGGGESLSTLYSAARNNFHASNQVSADNLRCVNDGLARLALTQEQYSELVALIQQSSQVSSDDAATNTSINQHQVNSTTVGSNIITGPPQLESDW